MRLVIMLFAATLTLSGCLVSAQDGDRRVVVSDGDRGDYYGGPAHCPPGHAKKGWC